MTPETSAPELTAPLQLTRSVWQPDDLHSATRLSELVADGQYVRVRRGIYLDAEAWVRSPRWIRAEIATAAMALRRPGSLFCRESALLLHGFPLALIPRHVTLRTTDPSMVGISSRGSMTGSTSAQHWLARYHARFPGDDATVAALTNFPTRRIETVLPHGMTRSSVRERRRAGTLTPSQTKVPGSALPSVAGPVEGYWVEPLELALADTAARMTFPEAVTVLDALLRRVATGGVSTPADPASWGEEFLSKRLTTRWQAAVDFADAAAESPGESVSRALIHELGFQPPHLQVVVDTDIGQQRVDFEWVLKRPGPTGSHRIVGEFDGRGKYFDEALSNGQTAKELHYAEKLREDALRRTGRGVVRWGWADLCQPDTLLRKLMGAGVPRGEPRTRAGVSPFFLVVEVSGPGVLTGYLNHPGKVSQ